MKMSFLAQNSELPINILSILQQIKATLIPFRPSHPLLAFIIAEHDTSVYCIYIIEQYKYHNFNYEHDNN